jgi:hypothetical protein
LPRLLQSGGEHSTTEGNDILELTVSSICSNIDVGAVAVAPPLAFCAAFMMFALLVVGLVGSTTSFGKISFDSEI